MVNFKKPLKKVIILFNFTKLQFTYKKKKVVICNKIVNLVSRADVLIIFINQSKIRLSHLIVIEVNLLVSF